MRSLGWAGKVLEGEGHGHSEPRVERPGRSGGGREEEKRIPSRRTLGRCHSKDMECSAPDSHSCISARDLEVWVSPTPVWTAPPGL